MAGGICAAIPSCRDAAINAAKAIRDACSVWMDEQAEDKNCEALYQSTSNLRFTEGTQEICLLRSCPGKSRAVLSRERQSCSFFPVEDISGSSVDEEMVRRAVARKRTATEWSS